MNARLRVVARLLVLSLLLAAAVAGVGVLIAVLRDGSMKDSVAYASSRGGSWSAAA